MHPYDTLRHRFPSRIKNRNPIEAGRTPPSTLNQKTLNLEPYKTLNPKPYNPKPSLLNRLVLFRALLAAAALMASPGSQRLPWNTTAQFRATWRFMGLSNYL